MIPPASDLCQSHAPVASHFEGLTLSHSQPFRSDFKAISSHFTRFSIQLHPFIPFIHLSLTFSPISSFLADSLAPCPLPLNHFNIVHPVLFPSNHCHPISTLFFSPCSSKFSITPGVFSRNNLDQRLSILSIHNRQRNGFGLFSWRNWSSFYTW